MIDILGENDTYVSQLRLSIGEGQAGLAHVPALLKRIIHEHRWRERRIKTGVVVPFERFEDFVCAPPLEGLGATLPMLQRLCKDDKAALDAIDQVTQGGTGVNNGNARARPVGNTEQAALRRLRKDRPDLLDDVKAGKLSAHAAMVQAGFREPSLTIPSDPIKAAKRLLRHFHGESLDTLIRELQR